MFLKSEPNNPLSSPYQKPSSPSIISDLPQKCFLGCLFKPPNCCCPSDGRKMAFNSSYSAEEHFLMNPKHLLFTQPDIKSTFKDSTYPSVRETASLLRDGQLSPHDFGPLHVSIDEHGNIWSDNNRRLFAFREAAVDFVPVVSDGTRRPKYSLKGKLGDPNFMPRIRGEASRVQIPPTPTSFRWNGCQIQNEPESSHPGSVSAGYWNTQPYNSYEDEDEEDELGDMFSQLAINGSTSTYSTYGEGNPDVFDQSHVISNFDLNEFWNPNCRLYAQKEGEDDYAPVCLNGNWRGTNAVESKPNDPAYMPRISCRGSGVRNPPQSISGGNGYQMEKGTSLMGSVSKRDLYDLHEEDEVQYKYWYIEEDVEVDYEYQALGEAKCEEEYGYEDEGKYEYPVPSEGNGLRMGTHFHMKTMVMWRAWSNLRTQFTNLNRKRKARLSAITFPLFSVKMILTTRYPIKLKTTRLTITQSSLKMILGTAIPLTIMINVGGV